MNIDKGMQKPEECTLLGIGEQLRAARLAKRISTVWVANHLHLSEAAIDAIECEAFEQLPAPVFVKGYIRAFARVVGEDELALVDLYAASVGEVKKPVASLPKITPKNVTRFQPVTTGLMVLALAVTLTTVWSFLQGRGFDVSNQTIASDSDWSAIGVAHAETAKVDASAGRGSHSIVFEFTADSWVKVRDKKGEKVLRGMMPAGTVHGLSGLPPFDITIGNSAGVVITQNGIVYDHGQHVRGNVAHFALGQ
ncbi:MAG: helix-turn-helix domain-containing protein [Methylococcales bacterium]|jgi:cytoskeleton protein RodZ|nr:helix-turn-helix domain-containing protein [Methylococcales bacterium]MBT7445937.1 helix-turn-helix domain-containing protein [Methylococcales bacterium]